MKNADKKDNTEVASVFFIAAETSVKTDKVIALMDEFQNEDRPLTLTTKPHLFQYDREIGQTTVAHKIQVPMEVYDDFIARARAEDLSPQPAS